MVVGDLLFGVLLLCVTFAARSDAAVLRRRHAYLVQEEAGEVALGRETELRRYFGDLAAAGRQPRDRRFDAQQVEIRARRKSGAELEQVVEARARQAHLRGELVHAEALSAMRAQKRDGPADAA